MNKKYLSVILLITTLILSSCEKEYELVTTHTSAPVITFISPTQSVQVNEQDTLWIKINISAEDDLHEYLIQIRDIVENKIVYSYEGHSHLKSVQTNLFWLPNVNTDAEMELIVTTMDHNSNKSSKSISFKVLNTIHESKPVIEILSPTFSMYNNGDQISIKGSISHDKNLRETSIQLTRNGNTVFSYNPLISQINAINFDTTYSIAVTEYSDFELIVTATDITQNSTVKTQRFHVHK